MGDIQAGLVDVHSDDPSCPEQAGTFHGAKPNWTSSQNRDGISRLNLTKLRAKVSAGKDISHEKGALIRERRRDNGKPLVRKRDPDIFRLAAVDAAAKFPAAPLAVVDISMLAEPALAAKGNTVGGHPVPRRNIFYTGTGFHNLSHEFMPQDRSWNSPRYCPVQNMEITGTDCGQADFDNGVGRVPQNRQRSLL